jgi:8-hydroxy-5-deazaflavin:NADPH oxidoreductase
MKVRILGTGIVGDTIGSALIANGHEVMMGSRTATNEKAVRFANTNGSNASHGTFNDVAQFGDIIFNCTKGEHSLEALGMAGEADLAGKIVIDLANPLDFSKGMPPTLSIVNDNSLGETLQSAFPKTRIVKALNTLNCTLMINPSKLSNGDHDLFICGDDAEAKRIVTDFLSDEFGWKKNNIHDLGDITNSRGTEQLLPLWIRMYFVLGTGEFNFKIVR